ncbi:hypothetical protein EW093_12570 [Thiospirochaeta perfilievii]|uniref:Lipoprotein n=1 Tax=Thiospirochaeta perfilievii TaxID=252967 RepID=A0A5C1QBR7_9SPIO|nr:hypothetical protein [Thiospirochaeta perfilievii]QEN05513.1 hypothetical protein EW093_12570 [Thiospirochaeta perfilievii]
MKRIITIITLIFLLSCQREEVINRPSYDDVKYYTTNSTNPDFLIKTELESKDTVILSYPDYVSQSYSLIKYISAIIKKSGELTIYLEGLPNFNENIPVIDTILKEQPKLGFKEFIDIYTFFKDSGIKFTGNKPTEFDKLLILSPESDNPNIEGSGNEIEVKMVGIRETSDLFPIVQEIPAGKKISSVYSRDDKSTILIFMGIVTEYNPIEAIELYSINNYLEAPEDFLLKNKSIFKKRQLNKMNNMLTENISENFKIYGGNR